MRYPIIIFSLLALLFACSDDDDYTVENNGNSDILGKNPISVYIEENEKNTLEMSREEIKKYIRAGLLLGDIEFDENFANYLKDFGIEANEEQLNGYKNLSDQAPGKGPKKKSLVQIAIEERKQNEGN